MSIFGSSNWTSPSDNSQEEHNCFCTDADDVPVVHRHVRAEVEQQRRRHRERRLRPAAARQAGDARSRRTTRRARATSITLKWYGGLWAHKYDVVLRHHDDAAARRRRPRAGTERVRHADAVVHASPRRWRRGPPTTGASSAKTMANLSKTSDLWNFTTGGVAPPPPASGSAGVGDIVLYAAEAAGQDRDVEGHGGRERGRRRADGESEPECGQGHHRVTVAGELLRDDVHRRSRQAVSAVDARQGGERRLLQRFGLRAVLGFGQCQRRGRCGGSARRRPPK